MKITINGFGVTADNVQDVLMDLEKEYGLKIRDLTMYVRFVDDNGRVVNPKLPANGNELVVTIKKMGRPKDELSYDELLNMVEKAFGTSIHGQGLVMIKSWAEDYKLTKEEASKILEKKDQYTNLRTIEQKIINLRRKK